MHARTRPSILRHGARFACADDGLCCTDVHRLGPVEPVEARALGLTTRRSLLRDPALGALVFATVDGACVHRDASGCGLHRAGGARAKPASCRRFPFELVATPQGGRIVTSHRCPCRTLGRRPPLDAAEAEASLRGDDGRLVPSRRITRVRLQGARSVSFDRYLGEERRLLARIAASRSVVRALTTSPFPRLDGMRYADVADHLASPTDGTAQAAALALAGRAIRALVDRAPLAVGPQPWAAAFDRAQARATEPERPRAILTDFVADEIFGLRWAESLSLAVARAELATRLRIAERIARELRTSGTRPDRAMAEAVFVIDLLGASAPWGFLLAHVDEGAIRARTPR